MSQCLEEALIKGATRQGQHRISRAWLDQFIAAFIQGCHKLLTPTSRKRWQLASENLHGGNQSRELGVKRRLL